MTTYRSDAEVLDRAFRHAISTAREDKSLGAGQRATAVNGLEIVRQDYRWGTPLYEQEPISQTIAALQRDYNYYSYRLALYQQEDHPYADQAIDRLGRMRSLILDYLSLLTPNEIPGIYSQAHSADHLEQLLTSPPPEPAGRIDYAALKERVDIVEYIGRFTQLRRDGTRFKAICPFHAEKSPSFVIYPNTRSFYCFGCTASGDVIDFARLARQSLPTP